MIKRSVLCTIAVLIPMSAFAVDFDLTVTVQPPAGGVVTSDPELGPYVAGMPVKLTAIAMSGYRFDHWTGDLTGTANSQTLTMIANKAVTAVFVSDTCVVAQVQAVAPVSGTTINVGNRAGGTSLVFTVKTDCPSDTASVRFTLDSSWQGTAYTPSLNGLFTLSGPRAADVSFGSHTLTVTAFSKSDPEAVVAPAVITFELVDAPAKVDSDRNGVPDKSFDLLNAEGTRWLSSVPEADTGGLRVTAMARWDGNAASDDNRVVVAVAHPSQPDALITIAAPRDLLRDEESAILLVQVAPDLGTLYGAVEQSLLGAEPSVLVAGGEFIEVSVLVTPDDGANYFELDTGRFDEHPVHITLMGLDVAAGSTTLLYSHDTGFVRDPLTGDKLVAWAGPWSTDRIRNVVIGDATFDADAASLSVFAPYARPLTGPKLTLTPASKTSYTYGLVAVGNVSDTVFNVRNTGGGVLTGTAFSTDPPFSVVHGGEYRLGPGKSQLVTVRFTAAAPQGYNGNVIFTGGGWGVIYLLGSGYAGDAAASCAGPAGPSGGSLTDGIMIALAGLLLSTACRRNKVRGRTRVTIQSQRERNEMPL